MLALVRHHPLAQTVQKALRSRKPAEQLWFCLILSFMRRAWRQLLGLLRFGFSAGSAPRAAGGACAGGLSGR